MNSVSTSITAATTETAAPIKSKLIENPPDAEIPHGDSSVKIYKCGYCSYQSQVLGYVRFHLQCSHKNKLGSKKSIASEAKAQTLQPEGETVEFHQTLAKFPRMEQQQKESINQEESSMGVDDNNKDTVDIMDMMLSDNVPRAEEAAGTEQQEETENTGAGEETENSQKNTTVKEDKLFVKSESLLMKKKLPSLNKKKLKKKILKTVKWGVDGDAENLDNKTGNLDIESIHNDNPSTNSGDTKKHILRFMKLN